jgi:hypothetical protein
VSEFCIDFRIGATAIANKLKQLGLIAEDDANAEDKVYYLARTGKLPIGKWGKNLISSDAKLEQAAKKLVA